MLELFQQGGTFMYVVLALALLAAPIALIAALVPLARLRVPLAVYLLFPALVVLAGQGGTLVGVHAVSRAVAYVAPETKAALLAEGMAEAAYPRLFALLCAGSILAFSALVAGATIGLRGAPQDRWTPAHGATGVVLALFATPALVGAAYYLQAGIPGMLVGLLTGMATLGTGLVAARWTEKAPHAERLAAARVGIPLLGLLGVAAFGLATAALAQAQTMSAVAHVDVKMRSMLLEEGMQMARQAFWLGLGGVAVVLIAGLPGIAASAHRLRGWFTAVSAAVATLVLLPVIALAIAGPLLAAHMLSIR